MVAALLPSVPKDVRQRLIARDLDHAAHLGLLHDIDRALHDVEIEAVALKGALFAERYYARPSARATSDVDLLVREADLETATAALEGIGYVAHSGRVEDRYRREHHHLHLEHPSAMPLELHFHAYRGFGSVLPSEEVISRRRPMPGYDAIGVLSPEDELVYLAVHAAAHRFMRLGWLWDIRLMLERMTGDMLLQAHARAARWGFDRVLAFTRARLHHDLGHDVPELGSLDSASERMLEAIFRTRENAWLRASTQFLYATALCATPTVGAQHALTMAWRKARDQVT